MPSPSFTGCHNWIWELSDGGPAKALSLREVSFISHKLMKHVVALVALPHFSATSVKVSVKSPLGPELLTLETLFIVFCISVMTFQELSFWIGESRNLRDLSNL